MVNERSIIFDFCMENGIEFEGHEDDQKLMRKFGGFLSTGLGNSYLPSYKSLYNNEQYNSSRLDNYYCTLASRACKILSGDKTNPEKFDKYAAKAIDGLKKRFSNAEKGMKQNKEFRKRNNHERRYSRGGAIPSMGYGSVVPYVHTYGYRPGDLLGGHL